jgi:DNA-binding transcriptional LysR family regulator
MTTLRALECLAALAEHRSVSKAAAALYMSQPAMSHQIASLERELGAPVVERHARGVWLTAAGRAAAEEAQVAIAAATRAIQLGKMVSRARAGRIRISCAETMTTWLLVPVLRQWRSQHPDVEFDLSEFTSADMMVKRLEAGRTDISIGPRPTSTTAHISFIGVEEMVVVVPPNHRFAELTDGVPVRELADEPFVHYDLDHGMAFWVDQFADSHGVVLDPILRTRSPRTAAQLAAAGIGATLVPVSALTCRPAGVVRRLQPHVERDIIAVVAAPSDTLVRRFLADIQRRGLPTWSAPTLGSRSA